MEIEINVNKYVDTYVGRQTLDKVEKEIKKEIEKGNRDIVVNVEGLSINTDYTYLIAGMVEKYKCKFKGIGSKEEYIDALINTWAFVKGELGTERYVGWFKSLVENADYPLMIYDNRVKGNKLVDMHLIQPLIFDDNFFHYNIIKQQYLEPVDLEKAMKNKENIFSRETIRLVDLVNIEEGFRFASNDEERYILDIFEDILSENYWDF